MTIALLCAMKQKAEGLEAQSEDVNGEAQPLDAWCWTHGKVASWWDAGCRRRDRCEATEREG